MDSSHLELTKYLGHSYKLHEWDCITLVKKYYKNEYNIDIELPEYNSYNDIYKYSLSSIQIPGFEKVGFDKIKEGCILVFNVKNKETLWHFGLFMPPVSMLHVEYNDETRIEQISDSYRERLGLILRRKNEL